MRLVDVMMSFPVIVLIIAIVAITLGPAFNNMYLAMWLVGWTSYARLVRSAVMVEKNAEYVQAARTLGYSICASPVPPHLTASSPAPSYTRFQTY